MAAGTAGLTVLVIYAVLLFGTPLYVAGDITTRDGDHLLAWTLMSFFGALWGWLPWMVFYLVVREDVFGPR